MCIRDRFEWARSTRRRRLTWLVWWAVLVPSGWCLFLPGVLDHFKYTDGLVGHALMEMCIRDRACITGVVGALYPAFYATRIRAVEALRFE